MGLSGNTRKQKIPEDPRNVKWANDTSAPGFRLLSSMGWTPDAPSLGLASSQSLITAGGSSAFSKKISVIPIAKEDNLGIGARRGAGSAGMRAMGIPMMLGGAGGMGFVTAAPTLLDAEGKVLPPVQMTAPGGGGEYGNLLARLNAANLARAAAAQAEEAQVDSEDVEMTEPKEETKAERKARRALKRETKRKRAADDEGDEVKESETLVVAVETVLDSATTMLLKNPRMAARSKHLRAKRMASSSSAASMAEILGIAPSESPSASGSGHSTPVPSFSAAPTPAVIVQPITNSEVKDDNGWPAIPARAFPVFASSSSTGLAATFTVDAPLAATALVVEDAPVESDKQIAKREKAERKASRQIKRDSKAAKVAASSIVAPTTLAAIGTSLVSSATSFIASTFPSFTSSSTTGLAATFTPPAAVAPVEPIVVAPLPAAVAPIGLARPVPRKKDKRGNDIASVEEVLLEIQGKGPTYNITLKDKRALKKAKKEEKNAKKRR